MAVQKETSAEDFRTLARLRIREAAHLLTNGFHSGAYYLSGYAVECGLKAVIAMTFREGVLPSKQFVNSAYTHDLNELVKLAGLKPILDRETARSAELLAFWSIATTWEEGSRYQIIDPFAAEGMFRAVAHPTHGVLKWLQQHW